MAFSGAVYAAPNRVELGTNVPNIPKSLCYQAGSISMEFSAGTVLRSGDVIQFTLQNGVTLCKDIDFYVRLHDGEALDSTPGTDVTVPVSATDAADVISVNAGAVPPVNVGPGLPALYDYGFRVKGLAGSQIIQLTVGSRSVDPAISLQPTAEGIFNENGNDDFTMTFNGVDPANVLTVSIFDEKADAVDGLGRAYLYKDDPDVAGILYDQDFDPANPAPFTFADNTICIDTLTQDYQGERVEVTPDSLTVLPDNKLTFTGEREIARILPENEYVLATCKDAPRVGNIELGEGQSATCPAFDYDDGTGYCPDTHDNNKIIIQALTTPYQENDYTITLEVLVNGNSGDLGVYIGEASMAYLAAETLDDACEAPALNALAFDADQYVVPGTCADCVGALPGGTGCTVDASNRVIGATTRVSDLDITRDPAINFLRLGLPAFRYDSAIVQEGDVVSVRVIVSQFPCGTIFNEEIEIGTFGCGLTVNTSELLYPYFTPANGTYFWSAYAITNVDDREGTVTLYMYESDGDAFKGDVATPVPARGVWATRLDDSIVDPDITWTQIAGTGTPGDAAAYIKAMTTFYADGFGFIAGSPTGESMGYLPRVKSETMGSWNVADDPEAAAPETP
jgi:hypothetical protein